MVSGDFDEDGVSDLVIGYGLEDGGSLQLLHGNLDARAPQTHESWLNAGRHEYSDPYVQRLKPIHTTLRPSLMISADVNGDGHLDLVSATKGSSQLSVMFGDGKGNCPCSYQHYDCWKHHCAVRIPARRASDGRSHRCRLSIEYGS